MRIFPFSPHNFVKNITAGNLLENFLISAIATVLCIRFFLFVTAYPQVGGNGLHIAHLLWGGLFMFIALSILSTFLNNTAKSLAVVLGGIGFGTFVDELGKFITSNHDYFFQPTVAIIYIIFIALYLFIRMIDNKQRYSHREYLINAIEMIKEAANNDMDYEEKKLALYYLKQCDPKDPFVKDLREILYRTKLIETQPTTIFSFIKRRLHEIYLNLVKKRWFLRTTLFIFGLSALVTLFRSLVFVYGFRAGHLEQPNTDFSNIAQLVFSTISAILVIIGGIIMFQKRLSGFKLLKYSILISIFFTQVFAFYQHQFEALLGLLGNILLYLIIQYYINEETTMSYTLDED